MEKLFRAARSCQDSVHDRYDGTSISGDRKVKMSDPGTRPSLISFHFKLNLQRLATAACQIYLAILLGWLFFYVLTGDRYPYLGLFNYIALYLYLPLPLVLLVAALTRRRGLRLGSLVGLASFLMLWGRQSIPTKVSAAESDGQLTVMSFNVWGARQEVESALQLILDHDPDVLFIQELNHDLADLIEANLAQAYPFQILDPGHGFEGMGVISRLPIEPTGEHLPLRWVGTPQILRLIWQDREITLINFHMWATGLAPVEVLQANFRAREAQALTLAEFARRASQSGPVIAAGDGNFAPLSDAHALLSIWLLDAWEQAGLGWGHTYPAGKVNGRLPRLSGVPVPPLFYRIDYIFHSGDLTTIAAKVAPHDGLSDHRAVLVGLVLSE